MSVNSRQLVLGVALGGSLLAAFAPGAETSEQMDVAEPAVRAQLPPLAESVSTGETHLAERLQRSEVLVSNVDPFRTKSWYVAPPLPPAPQLKPTAPPFPFRYMGMLEDQGRKTIYLVRGDESFAVAQGERFADAYRLDRIERSMLVISYLPLAAQQTLPIGINE